MPSTPKSRLKQFALQRIRLVTHLLDNALPIPGTKVRVGIDPLLGLLPGAGDWVSMVLSVYIILESLRFGLPKETLTQMVSNLVLDAVSGVIPIAGDIFDVAWKANNRNLKLLEAHLQDPQPTRPADRLFVFLIVLLLIGILASVTALVIFIGNWLWQLIR